MDVNWLEMLILGVVGLLLFGKRLPEIARDLGKEIGK
jgi:TatA/E family protein of Tat protein translocase